MKKVAMYTLSTCPWCRKTRKFFKDAGVEFNFVDYDLADETTQDRIVDEMSKQTGSIAFPFVKIENEIVQGYNPEKYRQLLQKN
jgi:glutaredoxin